MCNNNARPNLSTLRDTTACPVVVPSIQITANADDRTDTDVTYAEIRRLRSQPSLRRAAISGQSRSSSKGSGEYVDLTEKLASELVNVYPVFASIKKDDLHHCESLGIVHCDGVVRHIPKACNQEVLQKCSYAQARIE